ncbi:MAG: hypothetical protein ABIE74_11475 [Pseudomonadota bacterium]
MTTINSISKIFASYAAAPKPTIIPVEDQDMSATHQNCHRLGLIDNFTGSLWRSSVQGGRNILDQTNRLIVGLEVDVMTGFGIYPAQFYSLLNGSLPFIGALLSMGGTTTLGLAAIKSKFGKSGSGSHLTVVRSAQNPTRTKILEKLEQGTKKLTPAQRNLARATKIFDEGEFQKALVYAQNVERLKSARAVDFVEHATFAGRSGFWRESHEIVRVGISRFPEDVKLANMNSFLVDVLSVDKSEMPVNIRGCLVQISLHSAIPDEEIDQNYYTSLIKHSIAMADGFSQELKADLTGILGIQYCVRELYPWALYSFREAVKLGVKAEGVFGKKTYEAYISLLATDVDDLIKRRESVKLEQISCEMEPLCKELLRCGHTSLNGKDVRRTLILSLVYQGKTDELRIFISSLDDLSKRRFQNGDPQFFEDAIQSSIDFSNYPQL